MGYFIGGVVFALAVGYIVTESGLLMMFIDDWNK